MILAIDQGTTGTTCLVVDESLRPVGRGYREIAQHFPQPGWVEHDPEELWASVLETAAAALAAAGITARDLTAIGITNQRETTVVWERAHRPARCTRRSSGRTAAPRRAAPAAGRARARAHRPRLRPVLLGLEARVDPGAHRRSRSERLAFGTVDAWIAWKLTGGAAHVTDVTNASRTMLLDLATGDVGRRAAARSSPSTAPSSPPSCPPPASWPRRRCSARRCRSRASPATSRRRSSARAASRRAR